MSEAPKNRKRFERNRKTGSRSVQKKHVKLQDREGREKDVKKKRRLCLCKWWHKLVLSFVHACAKEQLQKKNRTPSQRDTFTWKKRRGKKETPVSALIRLKGKSITARQETQLLLEDTKKAACWLWLTSLIVSTATAQYENVLAAGSSKKKKMESYAKTPSIKNKKEKMRKGKRIKTASPSVLCFAAKRIQSHL